MASSEIITARKSSRQQETRAVRVLIVAASHLTRAGLERRLEPEAGIQVLDSFSNVAELVRNLAKQDPDVLLIHTDAGLGLLLEGQFKPDKLRSYCWRSG